MPDVRRLRLLRQLAYRGTISAVADALCCTPSAVFTQFAILERDAGVPLLQRSRRRVCLTPAGTARRHHADEVVTVLALAAAGQDQPLVCACIDVIRAAVQRPGASLQRSGGPVLGG